MILEVLVFYKDVTMKLSFWKNKKLWASLVCVSIIILSIVLSFYFVIRNEHRKKIDQIFEEKSQIVSINVNSDIIQLFTEFETIDAAFGIYANWSFITQDVINYLVPEKQTGNQSIYTIAYQPILPHSQRAQYEDFISQHTGANHTIMKSLPNGTRIVSPEQDFYIPVGLNNFNSPGFGVDLYQIPDRKETLNYVFDHMSGAVTDVVIALVPGQQLKLLVIFLPIKTIYGDTTGIIGYALFIDKFFKEITSFLINYKLNIHIALVGNKLELMYSSQDGIESVDQLYREYGDFRVFKSTLYNKQVVIYITKTEDFDDHLSQNNDVILLSVGLVLWAIIMCLIVGLFYSNDKHQQNMIKVAKESIELTYSRVISYICHELRNPLNLLHSSLFIIRSENLEIAGDKAIESKTVVNVDEDNDENNDKNNDENNDENNESVTDNMISINYHTLQSMSYSVHKMKNIVDEVLYLQKMVDGHFNISLQQFNIVSHCQNILIQNSFNISQDIEISLAIDKSLEDNPIIISDPSRIDQIILNGLTNAIKFTERGQIIIRLIRLQGEADKVYLSIEILNTGIGLGGINQETLFTPFSQGVSSVVGKPTSGVAILNEDIVLHRQLEGELSGLMIRARCLDTKTVQHIQGDYEGKSILASQKGSGLGLPISRMIAIRLGGFLTLKDDLTFTRYHVIVDISTTVSHTPYTAINIDSDRRSIGPSQTGIGVSPVKTRFKILLIDDDEMNLSTGKSALTILGYNVDVMEDAKDIDYEGVNKYDIILMDIIMKNSSGLTTCRKLKKVKYRGIILATTGNLTQKDIDVYKEYQFDGVYGKPFVYSKTPAFFQKLVTTRQWNVLV